MKKWLIGCLVTGLVLLVIGGGLFYWLIWPRISSAGSNFIGQVDDLKKIGQAEEAVKNQSSFTAPADRKLTAAQVTAFVAIQQTISDKMGPDFALMEDKYKKMSETQTNPADTNLKDVMGAYADITRLMAKAKEAQVAGLNDQNMSSEEYRWIRNQVSAALPYLSMDMPAHDASQAPETPATPADNKPTDKNAAAQAAVDDAIAKARKATAEALKQNMPGGEEMQDAKQGMDSPAIRANVELLRPHMELLMKTMTAAWVGM